MGTRMAVLLQPSLCTHLFSVTTLTHLCVKLQASNESQYQSNQYPRINVIRALFHSLGHRRLTKNCFPYFFWSVQSWVVFFKAGTVFQFPFFDFLGRQASHSASASPFPSKMSILIVLTCLTVWGLQHMSHLKDLMTVQSWVSRNTRA